MKRLLLVVLIVILGIIGVSCSGTAWVNVANEHETVVVDTTPYDPVLRVTVNGEEKIINYSYDENWEITWINLLPWEDVTVSATISYPSLSNSGLFEESFRVKDEDDKYVVIYRCTGYQP